MPGNLPSNFYNYPVRVTVTSERATAQSAPFNLLPDSQAALEVLTASLPSGVAGNAYSYLLEARGGVAPYRWSVSGEAGVGSVNIDTTTGMLSVNPQRPGNWRLTVTAKDANNSVSNKVLMFSVVGAPVVAAHEDGTLVLGLFNNPTSVSLIKDGKAWTFPSAEVFISHGYRWESIVPANSGDRQLFWGGSFTFAPGTLVRNSSNQREFFVIYLNNVKRGFSSYEVFQSMGYKPFMAYTADLSGYTEGPTLTIFDSHAPGTDINDGNTIYRINENNSRSAYTSATIYNTWHTTDKDFSRVLPANGFDRLIPVTVPMKPRFK